MQHLQNSDLRKLPSEKGKGIAGAAVIHLVLFALTLLVSFTFTTPPEISEGILVNFGTDETGSGLVEPSPSPSMEQSAPPLPDNSAREPSVEAVATQDFDKEAPEVKKSDPEAERKKRELAEAEKIRKAELEAERVKKAQEEAERKRVEEEQKRMNDIINKTKANISNAKNTGTSTTSEGVTGGTGNQGVTTGSVDSNVRGPGSGSGTEGVSFDLAGRSFQTLPAPKYDYQGEGKVVVEIFVDRTGKVTQATPGVKGSTTLDEYLLKVAREAALKTIFDPKPDAPPTQKGTITYNFKLK